jgi:hypothetical protein
MPAGVWDIVGSLVAACGVAEIFSGLFAFGDALELLLLREVDARQPSSVRSLPSREGKLVAVTGFAAAASPLTSASGAPAVANFLFAAKIRSKWGVLGSFAPVALLVQRQPLGEAPAWGLAAAAEAGAAPAVPVLPGALSTQFVWDPAALAPSALPVSASLRLPPAPPTWASRLRALLLLSSDEGEISEQLHLPLGALVTVVGAVRSVRLADGALTVTLARDWRRGLFLLGAGDFEGFRAAAQRMCGVSLASVAIGSLLAALSLRALTRARRHAAAAVALPPDTPPDAPAASDNARCVVCWEMASVVALAPCGHVCLCAGCLPRLARERPEFLCPTCRVPVASVVRVYQ